MISPSEAVFAMESASGQDGALAERALQQPAGGTAGDGAAPQETALGISHGSGPAVVPATRSAPQILSSDCYFG